MDYSEINRQLWNAKTDIHFNSEFYNVDYFLKGKSSLNPIELELLGDVGGKSILHLQCHFGLDTLSLAREGARVTGVDLSDRSIEKANELAKEAKLKARFIRSNIYKLPEVMDEKFDIVFTSYGVIGWLPDMERWAQTIARFLKPGGRFVMVEFHPVVWMFSYDFKTIEFSYSSNEPIIEELEGTYTNRDAEIKQKSVSWNHGLSKVINALINSGLTIEQFNEHDFSPYNCFQNTVETEKGKFQIKGLEGKIPMLYSVKAQLI
ncbi:MAG: class I SAM-dependent methyltransferase [Prolixibacteraceae bacterium]|nr:class I SAM-dependent methyltransferase [Prolixibacteraceae bacterium]